MTDDAKQTGKASVLDVALAAHAAGLSVLPPHPTEKRPRLDWLRYQSGQMPVEQLRAELSDRLGIVTGYGNVECIDFDLAGFACIAWRERVEASAPGLVARLYVERSPSGGRHVIYRCSEIAGNVKLTTFRLPADAVGGQTAQRLGKPLSYTVTDTADGRMVTIGNGKPVRATKQRDGTVAAKVCPVETRGTGGWLIVAPSPGYVIERGSLADLTEITPAERQVLIDAAVALSDAEPVAAVRVSTGQLAQFDQRTGQDERPGDIYNATGDHAELLTRNGWTLDHTEGQNEHWTRPGKNDGTSATWHTGKRTFYLFSSSVGELEPEQGHSLFAVRAALEHAGDLSACAREIRAEQRPRELQQVPPIGATSPVAPRIVLRSHADRMRERFAPPDMMIAGVLAVGGIGAIIALPGAGKTLAGIELARCCAAGGLFLGRQVKSGRVIYCCTDSPASTERRILAVSEDAAQSIDTVTEMPAMPGSIRDLRLLAEAARTAGDPVGMIVIDTWDSTRDHTGGGYAEQDGAIEESMRELRRLAADLALCVVLIHHCTRSENGRARGSLVFDARCDWIANAEGDGHTVTLKTTKCRDGEAGTLGTWNITTAMVNGTPMPVLTQSDAAPKPVETAPDQRMTAMVAYLASHPGKAAARTLQDKLGWKSLSHVTRAAQDARAAGYMEAADYTLTPAGFTYADSVQGYLNKTPLFSPPRTAVQVEHGQPEQTENTECSGRTATRTDPECSGPPPVCSTGEAEQGADGVGEEVMG